MSHDRYTMLAVLLLWLGSSATWAQVSPTTGKNYVVEQLPRDALTAIDLTSPTNIVPASVGYVDGLGRPAQRVQVRGAGDGATDLVTGATTYDAYGRPQQAYLPLPGGVGGVLQANPQSAGAAFYGNDANPFAETVYEASPLNRVARQWGAGQAWRTANRSTAVSYGVATSNTVVRFSVSGTAIFGATAEGGNAWTYFGASEIASRTVTDEQNNLTVEYTDLQGRVVRRDVQTGGQMLTTAYVYDGYERLAAVIPPKLYAWMLNGANPNRTLFFLAGSAANPQFKDNAFVYQYDARSRIQRKHVPSAGWTDLVYDRLDRPVMSQDEQDRAEGQWRYMRYDGLSRVLQTGRMALSRSATDLQTDFAGVDHETYPATVNPPEASQLTLSQYDNYTDALAYQSGGAFAAPYPTATGLVTRSRVRNLDTTAWYESAMWYDDKGRVVQAQHQQVTGGTDRTDVSYRFNGEVQQSVLRHQNGAGGAVLPITTVYGYDHLGRKTSLTHQVGGNAAQTLASYSYDGVGRLVQKQLGGGGNATPGSLTRTSTPPTNTVDEYTDFIDLRPNDLNIDLRNNTTEQYMARTGLAPGTSALQSIDYSWHIRGGLRGLNLDGSGSPSLNGGKLFAMKLGYEEGGYYDGNISSQQWKTAPDGQLRSYTYSYDGASRLTGASGSGAGVVSLSNLSYDANGNLLSMDRAGIDALSYSYDEGNSLLSVSDGTGNTQGFADGNTSGNDYAYDAAGSVSKDLNKGISLIEYNLLKLPRKISFANGLVVSYQYDAFGTKLAKSTSTGSVSQYVGGIVYEKGILYQIAHEEGRVIEGGNRYEWSLADHLGNLRLSFAATNGVAQLVQAQDYDPWGWELPGTISAGNPSNKFKFNGIEQQSETGLYMALFRSLDPTIGRWLSVDPRPTHYASPFMAMNNNPIRMADPMGDTVRVDAGKIGQLTYSNGNLFNKDGTSYTGKVNGFLRSTVNALNQIGQGQTGSRLLSGLQSSKLNFTIQRGENKFVESSRVDAQGVRLGIEGRRSGSGGVVNWEPSNTSGGPDLKGSAVRPAYVGLSHELGHAEMSRQGRSDFRSIDVAELASQGRTMDEYNAMYFENFIRAEHGLLLRKGYSTDESGNTQAGAVDSSTFKGINRSTPEYNGYDFLLDFLSNLKF